MNDDYPVNTTSDDFDSDENIVTSDDFSSEELYMLLHIIEDGTEYIQGLIQADIDKNPKHRKKKERISQQYSNIHLKAMNWIGVIAEDKEEEEEEANCEICNAIFNAQIITSEESVEHT